VPLPLTVVALLGIGGGNVDSLDGTISLDFSQGALLESGSRAFIHTKRKAPKDILLLGESLSEISRKVVELSNERIWSMEQIPFIRPTFHGDDAERRQPSFRIPLYE